MEDGSAITVGIIVALLVIKGASTLSVLSGVGKGIKWLSNINMVLSILLLGFFILFGPTAFFVGIWDYLVELPWLSFNATHLMVMRVPKRSNWRSGRAGSLYSTGLGGLSLHLLWACSLRVSHVAARSVTSCLVR